MGHLGIGKEEVFKALARRLDKNPVGAPMNETLMQILYRMYEEKEARIASQFPQGFTTADKLSLLTGFSEEDIVIQLNHMADKGLVIDIPRKGRTLYSLTPLVIGFFEYTFMRVTDKLPMKDLAELFEKYHHEKGVSEEFFGADTKMFQTWTYESLMPEEVETEVLDYEKASAMIRDAGGGSLTMCYCRHQALHRGTVCDAPIHDVCMSLGNASEWLVRRGFARPASVDEMLRVLEQTEALGLVHLADNVQKNPAYLCHCCGCCCGVLRSINEHDVFSVHRSNFIPEIALERCNGCGACVKRCHIHAIKVAECDVNGKKAIIDTSRCIGCGACVKGCNKRAIRLVRRDQIYIPPKDKREQMTRIAREKGKL
ncbi:4Fe-4S binding protein [Heliobacterium chlorum]|uniref:4Fe-4S binding protein n=1 Tax=Heliobacterium chlorum TaxID=2698 RepID=A0ABR7T479_HELCL|nr:4Fe-4S binding protein [Heliobacterium chlorum]MBC9785583.1 4Fe-4S binding protein [Heliobacterium chlorum]